VPKLREQQSGCQLSVVRQDKVSNMARDVTSLEVFRRAYALSLDVHRVSLGFPKTEQFGGIADQLRRASKSVCALLAEGAGRQAGSDVEFRRYVRMALGSADEAKLWCRYISAISMPTPPSDGVPPSPRSGACCKACANVFLTTDG
jgi:four helix bundle protein